MTLRTQGFTGVEGLEAAVGKSWGGVREYPTALLTHFGHWVQPERRQTKGPLPKPRWMPMPRLLYAQVIKVTRRRRLVEVKHRVVFGTKAAVEQVLTACGWQINTAFIERVNLSLRQHVAAIGRRVTTLGKGEDGLRQQLAADGIDATLTSFQRFADARYVGQGYELRVAMPDGQVGEASIQNMAEAFHRQHETEYGHFFAESPIEIVSIRMTGVGRTHKIERPSLLQAGSLDDAYIKTSNSVFRVPTGLQRFPTKFYQRERLPLHEPLHGPAIIVQTDSTTVIPPGCHTQADPYGSLIISIGDYA